MSLAIKAALLGAFAATTLAHGTVTGVKLDGVFHQGFLLDYYYKETQGQPVPKHIGWYAENLDNGFVDGTSYGSSDINCHKNAKTTADSASIAAGGKIDWLWSNWPESHMGPVITYVAAVDDYATATPEALKWVKIEEAGYSAQTKSWAAVDLIKTNNTWTTTVPSTLKAGKYVFRHEIIALHGAGELNGAQNYPQCLNIEVTGSGTTLPEGVAGTALYKNTDAGIKFSPYAATIDYKIPGPALAFGAGAGNGGSTPAPSASAAPSAAPSASAPGTPVATATPTPTQVAVEATATPSASATPANPGNGNSGSGETLPETFTLETFIAWLKTAAGGSSAKARRHARQF
ncbi:endoglucanase-4 [Dendryphion nanum]|uniref:Endoglucanase-4 n=1 Tax=Dendryphion nanum TaxID=256645 RepID=A0A9P9IHK8_9PLEO|nr:endoglucanase-4 [Dendryphion nanum]